MTSLAGTTRLMKTPGSMPVISARASGIQHQDHGVDGARLRLITGRVNGPQGDPVRAEGACRGCRPWAGRWARSTSASPVKLPDQGSRLASPEVVVALRHRARAHATGVGSSPHARGTTGAGRGSHVAGRWRPTSIHGTWWRRGGSILSMPKLHKKKPTVPACPPQPCRNRSSTPRPARRMGSAPTVPSGRSGFRFGDCNASGQLGHKVGKVYRLGGGRGCSGPQRYHPRRPGGGPSPSSRAFGQRQGDLLSLIGIGAPDRGRSPREWPARQCRPCPTMHCQFPGPPRRLHLQAST